MDTYTKGILTVIAVCLVSITFQLSETKTISHANADLNKVHKVAICTVSGKNCVDIRPSSRQKLNTFPIMERDKKILY
tara:strand:+ start:304 stop:537 length:234 start_codon:yes stop_codon:yes gene_type:complete